MELFLVTAVEMPAEVVAPMRTAPMWKDLEALAPTLAYDILVMGDFRLPAHWATDDHRAHARHRRRGEPGLAAQHGPDRGGHAARPAAA